MSAKAKPGGCIRLATIEHRHPENPPCQYTGHRNQIGQPLGRSELGFLCAAARLEDLTEDFDLPTLGIPINLLDGIVAAPDGEIGDQLPFNLLAAFRSVTLRSMNDRQVQDRVAFLFPDWRQNMDFLVSDLERGSFLVAIAVSDINPVQTFDHDLRHFVGDRVISDSSKSVDARADQEMRSDPLGRAEELVDIALAITDMDASSWIIQ